MVPFLLIQIFLSTRRRLFWGFVIPALWTVFGVWMTISNYRNKSSNIMELVIFYILGNVIFIGLLMLFRYLRRRKAAAK
jgi:ABC-type nickel/cobalt efflux system permease component RcnA